MLSWNYYIRRKRLNVKEWLSSRNIRDYDVLCNTLESLGVEAPPLNEVSHYFVSAQKVSIHAPKKPASPAPKRNPAVKSSTKKKSKTVISKAKKKPIVGA